MLFLFFFGPIFGIIWLVYALQLHLSAIDYSSVIAANTLFVAQVLFLFSPFAARHCCCGDFCVNIYSRVVLLLLHFLCHICAIFVFVCIYGSSAAHFAKCSFVLYTVI